MSKTLTTWIVVLGVLALGIILGIECDGRMYHSSMTARERDYYRQKFLESKGWKIYRIWSTKWWQNKNKEIEKLDNYIKNLLSNIEKEDK